MIEPLEPRRLLASSISGTVFNDANADGIAGSSETGLATETVYLDQNFDNIFDNGDIAEQTNSHGQFSFINLTAGVYRLAVVVPSGFRQTSPAQNSYDISADGISDSHTGENFGLTSTGIIRGNVFNDTNSNGTKDISDTGISGIIVFIDTNKNGRLDPTELRRTTDANGNYRFAGLAPKTYVIRIGVPTGRTVTFPATGVDHVTVHSGQSRSNRDFGLA